MTKPELKVASQVSTLPAGSYRAADNLFLRVTPTGSRSWVFRYRDASTIRVKDDGKRTTGVIELGLGKAGTKAGTKERGLGEARDLAAQMREALRKGDDPKSLVPKSALKDRPDPNALTFRDYAADVIEAKKRVLTNKKAAAQWESTLKEYAYPHIGDKRPGDVSYGDIERVLNQPSLVGKLETMSRLRQRLQAVLDYAAKREGEPHRFNPVLAYTLPKRKGETAVKHHAAAPWQEVPKVMAALRERDSTSAMLLRFSILTAARSGEVRGAMWAEIDLEGAVWTIPANRMKGRRLQRNPLNAEAVEVLKAMAERKLPGERVFPGPLGGLISDVAINKTLHSIMSGVTAHGFRSSFREWAAEATGFAREAVELCLAHVNTNRVEAAYQRSDLFEPRKAIMAAWGKFLVGKPNDKAEGEPGWNVK